MSLLLDALKRAEQEKLARAPEEPAVAPLRERPPAAGSLELQPLSTLGSGPSLGAAPRSDGGVHVAQAVFQAKAANGSEPRSRGMLWATVGAIGVVVIAAGAYVWYSINIDTRKQATFSPRRPAPAPPQSAILMPPPAPVAAPASGAMPDLAPAQSSGVPPANPPAAPVTAPVAAAVVAASPERPRSREPSVEEGVAQLLRESAAAPPSPPLRLDRTAQSARQVPADVAAGFDALRRGELPAARRSYGAAIAAEPHNLDAHLGLATVEARSGNRTTAAMHYRKALEIDPRNPTALAGLTALADFSRPDAIESRVRADLATNPESGPLHFTLGNVYAAQGRWNEAQLEYFEAHRLDPGSADVMFNLAVALDNLGQSRLAAGFYSRALEAARSQAPQFDTAAVLRRLEEIR